MAAGIFLSAMWDPAAAYSTGRSKVDKRPAVLHHFNFTFSFFFFSFFSVFFFQQHRRSDWHPVLVTSIVASSHHLRTLHSVSTVIGALLVKLMGARRF